MMKRLLLLAAMLALALPAASQQRVRDAWQDGTCADDGDVDTLETICTIETSGYFSIVFQGTVATAAFTDFDVAFASDVPDDCSTATYVTYYTASVDYTTPTGYLHSVSADPTTWTTTEISLKLDGLDGIGCVRLLAAGTSSNPDIQWVMQ